MDEIILPYDTITLVAINTKHVIQNTMGDGNDILYASRHGDASKAWLELYQGDSLTVDSDIYLLQKTNWENVVIPLVEF